jgi:hypothetical protein
MSKRATGLLAALMICLLPAAAFAQLTPYSQDFETLSQPDTGALGADGWLIFANVFGPGGTPYLYGYGPFPAPNDGGGFSAIAVGEGGGGQGAQQLSIYSDYNNQDHGLGNVIEANTFQEQTISLGEVGSTWNFDFDAKLGNLAGATTALAFIKTLDPNNGWATTNFITVDMTAIPATWGSYQLSITIDAGLAGQILQIGFSNSASNWESSGVFYDNVNFYADGTVDAVPSSVGALKSHYR